MGAESALGGTRTHGLSLRRAALYPLSYKRTQRTLGDLWLVPKEGFEPTHPCGYYALNVARLPFRHFGTSADARRLHLGVIELYQSGAELSASLAACEPAQNVL